MAEAPPDGIFKRVLATLMPEALPLKEKGLGFFQVWEHEQALLGQGKSTDNREKTTEGVEEDLCSCRSNYTIPERKVEDQIGNHNTPDEAKLKCETGRSREPYFIRRQRDTNDLKKTLGLALSGGGIRAGSFSLGVMQGLNAPRPAGQPRSLLQHVDYLSTVSGGGYAGAALTYYRFLARKSPSEIGEAYDKNVELDAFPKPESELLNRHESRMLDYPRFRRNHLAPTTFLNLMSLVAVAMRTVLTAWPIHFALLTAAMLVFVISSAVFGAFLTIEDIFSALNVMPSPLPVAFDNSQVFLAGTVALATAVVFALWMLVTGVIAAMAHWFEQAQYDFRRYGQKIFGFILTVFVIAVALTLIPAVSYWLKDPYILGVTVFIGSIVGAVSLISLRLGHDENRLISPQTILFVSALVILIGNLILAFVFAEYLSKPLVVHIESNGLFEVVEEGVELGFARAVFLAFFIFGLVLAFFTNLNYVSLTRMYRDRLMEAFMPNYAAFISKDNNQPATDADRLALWECDHRPLHLINTNIVLSTSQYSRYRGRSGDSFILAPHFCGSWATGYRETFEFSRKLPSGDRSDQNTPTKTRTKGRDNGMGLATAMSISGAAFSPRVGPSGWDTSLRHPLISSMASFLNLRLGFWVANPGSPNQHRRATFWNVGLRGILNYFFDEKRRLIELTDGGHFENTGLFELLRRRVDVIILADASADKRFNFKDVGIAIERARVDQSVDIIFDQDYWNLSHLMPGSASESSFDQTYEVARRGFAMATIKYPAFTYEHHETGKDIVVPEKEGTLIYLKSLVTQNLPLDIYSYKGAHSDFPYQAITDQDFDESQFEAYRELGYQVTRSMLAELEDKIVSQLEEPDDKSTVRSSKTPTEA